MRYYKKIIGKKVYLSPTNLEDADKYAEWLNDMEVSIKLSMPSDIISLDKEKELLEELTKNDKNFAIVDLESNELIGNCGYLNTDHINRKSEVGLFIGKREFWNKGYGEEVLKLLLGFGFNILNLNNIMLSVKEFNKPAISCYKKCGFKEIGRRRENTKGAP